MVIDGYDFIHQLPFWTAYLSNAKKISWYEICHK